MSPQSSCHSGSILSHLGRCHVFAAERVQFSRLLPRKFGVLRLPLILYHLSCLLTTGSSLGMVVVEIWLRDNDLILWSSCYFSF